MVSERQRPYVVSADAQGLMTRWSERNGYVIPANGSFFEGMLSDLQDVLSGYFPGGVEIIPEERLRSGLIQEVARSQFPVVSLERAYLPKNAQNLIGFIDATRAVDQNLNDVGIVARPGCLPLESQLNILQDQLKRKGVDTVALLDDVIFNGDGMLRVVDDLKQKGINVTRVIAGVGIKNGVDRLREREITVVCLEEFAEVVDEVCQRDYYVGVPYSGRTLVDQQGIIFSAPYLLPFGNPIEWASIPEDKAREFSEFCLSQSILLWTRVESNSQQEVPMKALPRRVKVVGIPEEISIVKALKTIRPAV